MSSYYSFGIAMDEIEFLSPEETFTDPELIRIAKGEKKKITKWDFKAMEEKYGN